MRKRIQSLALAILMALSLLPATALASEGNTGVPGGVTAKKELVCDENNQPVLDENGNYTIRLTVQGEPVEKPYASSADIVLVVDNSGSMGTSVGTPCNTPKAQFQEETMLLWKKYTCPECGAVYNSSLLGLLWDTRPEYCTGEKGKHVRMDTAKEVSSSFAQSILDSSRNRLAVVGFSHGESAGGADDSKAIQVAQPLTNDLTLVQNAIFQMKADGGTNYSAALQQAYAYLNGRSEEEKESRPAYVIFLSDGAPGRSGDSAKDPKWNGSQQVQALKADGVIVYAIGIALKDNESTYLKSLATDVEHYVNVTGENYSDQLSNVMEQWATQINSVPAGTNAVLTDVVNTEQFDLAEGGLSSNLTLAADGKTLTWNIGTIPSEAIEATILLKPKEGVSGKAIRTNQNVYLNYTDAEGASKTIVEADIGIPKVDLEAPAPAERYTVAYDWGIEAPGDCTLPSNSNTYESVETAKAAVDTTFNSASVSHAQKDGQDGVWTFSGWDGGAVVGTVVTFTGSWSFAAEETPDPEEPIPWDVSKSKVADGLVKQSDGSYTTNVTLSLPSAEEPLVSDVVFVLDKSTSAALEDQALAMLSQLKEQVDQEHASVQVGVVIFNQKANVANDGTFFDLSADYDEIKTAIEQDISSGTNMHAGLLAGKAMLDADTAVAAERKYLILVSDGITYMYDAEPTVTAWKFNIPFAAGDWHGSGTWDIFASPDNWYSKYHTIEAPEDWSAWLEDIGPKVDAQGTTYEYPYKGTVGTTTPEDIDKWDTGYAMSIDKALYLSNEVYQSAKDAGYHCYAMTAESETSAEYPWGASFVNYLAGGKSISFDSIQNDIYYLLDSGSTVNDIIGCDFDFVNDASKLLLTVGGETLSARAMTVGSDRPNETTCYAFGEGQENEFVLHYYAKGEDGNSEECFVWDINVPVSKFAPVQLTYRLQLELDKVQTAAGTYGVQDYDGSKGGTQGVEGGLFTNESAVLTAVDTAGNERVSTFNRPSVVYTVSGGGGGGGTTTRYTLTYESNGGTKYDSERYRRNTVVQLDKAPAREGYTFTGWYADKDLTEKIGEIKMTSNKTVYAGWEATGVPDWLNGEDHFAYIIGDDEGYARPLANVTRAETAAIFFRLLKADVREEYLTDQSSFADVARSAWYNKAVSTMAALGVVKGYTEDTFAPNEAITRAEFAAICARFDTGTTDGESNFTDISGHWAESEILRAAQLGWIQGDPDGRFRPNAPITRAEAMTIINRVLNRLPEEKEDLLEGMNEWPDNLPGAWYYLAVQEATNSHAYERKGEIYEHWTEMNTDPDWVQYQH